MYKIKLSDSEKDAIRRGDMTLMKKLLLQSNDNVVKELKKNRNGDLAYLQGISSVIDRLLEVLEV